MDPKKQLIIAGVDEVGRGPLAGPVVACAVILDPQYPIEGLKDSKKLSEKKRQQFSSIIQKYALSFAIAEASVAEIDAMNILQASLLAMRRAIQQLTICPNHVLVDGNHCPKIEQTSEAIIKGDETIPAISAASILAKVYRDNYMVELDKTYPNYGFAIHKGYPTRQHLLALKQFGVTQHHRQSFGPVSLLLQQQI